MAHKFERYQAVILEVDLPDDSLSVGAMGVVMDLVEPDGAVVEFVGLREVSLNVLTLPESCLRAETNEERDARITATKLSRLDGGDDLRRN